MQTPTSILVVTAGDGRDQAAIEMASRLAVRNGARLVVAAVLSGLPPSLPARIVSDRSRGALGDRGSGARSLSEHAGRRPSRVDQGRDARSVWEEAWNKSSAKSRAKSTIS